MAEDKMQIILEWVEDNPEVVAGVEKKVAKLYKQYLVADTALRKYNASLGDETKGFRASSAVWAEKLNAVRRTAPAYSMFTDMLEKQQEQEMAGVKKWEGLGKAISGFGRKVGFTGFIVTFSLQRIIRTLSQFVKYFTDAVKATANWPDKLMDVAYALALLETQGLATSDTQKLLSNTMDTLVSRGPAVEALWLGLQAVWTSIQTSLAVALIPTLTKVLAVLSEFLVTRGAQVALANLATAVGQLFIALAGMAPMIIQVVTVLAQLLSALGPLLPIIIPLVSVMLMLGMVCSVLGPIFTVLGSTIHFVTEAKKWWLVQTVKNTVAMHHLKLAIVTTISTLAILGVILWGLSQTATASATDISKGFDKLGSSATKMEWTITDANGNIIYTINTLTNDVKDSTGNIIGYYDSMSGSLFTTNDQLIGSINDVTGKFHGMDGSVSDVNKSISDLANLNLSNLTDSIGGLDTSLGNVNSTMNALNWVMGAVAAVSFAELIASIAQIALPATTVNGIIDGILTACETIIYSTIPSLATVFGGFFITAGIAWTALGTQTSLFFQFLEDITGKKYTISFFDSFLERLNEIKGTIEGFLRWLGLATPPATESGYLEPKAAEHGGQFGIKRVPKTGKYQLEKGEKVIATRTYGPVEEEPIESPLVQRIGEIGKDLAIQLATIATPSGQFGIQRVLELGQLEKSVTAKEVYRSVKEAPVITLVKQYVEKSLENEKFVQNFNTVTKQMETIKRERIEAPKGQFGVQKASKANVYQLEKGELIKSVGTYGPTEEESITTLTKRYREVRESPEKKKLTQRLSKTGKDFAKTLKAVTLPEGQFGVHRITTDEATKTTEDISRRKVFEEALKSKEVLKEVFKSREAETVRLEEAISKQLSSKRTELLKEEQVLEGQFGVPIVPEKRRETSGPASLAVGLAKRSAKIVPEKLRERVSVIDKQIQTFEKEWLQTMQKGQFGVQRVRKAEPYKPEKGAEPAKGIVEEPEMLISLALANVGSVLTKVSKQKELVSKFKEIDRQVQVIKEHWLQTHILKGQFGVQRVPKASYYKSEKGEKVKATREYTEVAAKQPLEGPVEVIAERIVKLRQGWEKIWEEPTQGQFGIQRVSESKTHELEKDTKTSENVFTQVSKFEKEVASRVETIEKNLKTSMIEKSLKSLEKIPSGQFGIPRVPRAGRYQLEKGERVESTRDYGPPEEGTVANVVTTTPQIISITNNFEIGTLSTELDAERLGDIVNKKIAEGIRRKRP